MAVTTQDSVQVAGPKATPSIPVHAADSAGRVRCKYFNFAQDGVGDADSIARLVKIPGGTLRILSFYLAHSALGAARTLDLGFEAHSDVDGGAIVADNLAYATNLDVAATGTKSDDINRRHDTAQGFNLVGRVQGGTFPDGATFEGYVLYVQD